jgi:hypothetical protein
VDQLARELLGKVFLEDQAPEVQTLHQAAVVQVQLVLEALTPVAVMGVPVRHRQLPALQ